MKTFCELVEQKKKEIRVNNISILRQEIDKSWVDEKISNYIIEFDGMFSKEEIKRKILEDDLVASFFIKAPAKQNISEKVAEEILGPGSKLPATGKNSIRFNDNGDIVSVAFGNTKSADFMYKDYYTTQKYTMNSGGSQDNQRNDVIDFLTRGSIKHKVCAIVDGDYWDKYQQLLRKKFSENPNVLITSMTEIMKEKGI